MGLASTGNDRSDDDDERGSDPRHGDDDGDDLERHLERVLARSKPGRAARKMTRVACQTHAPGHGHDEGGGGAATASMADRATVTGSDGEQLGKTAALTVSR